MAKSMLSHARPLTHPLPVSVTVFCFTRTEGANMDKKVERNFVAALPEYRPRMEVLPPDSAPQMAPPAQTSVTLHTTYTDRSIGFQVATLPISIAFGVGALVVATVGYSVPILSLGALAVFWLAFLGWWLLGWAIHHAASPDGIALTHTILMWLYLGREQKERLRRYGKDGK